MTSWSLQLMDIIECCVSSLQPPSVACLLVCLSSVLSYQTPKHALLRWNQTLGLVLQFALGHYQFAPIIFGVFSWMWAEYSAVHFTNHPSTPISSHIITRDQVQLADMLSCSFSSSYISLPIFWYTFIFGAHTASSMEQSPNASSTLGINSTSLT